MKKHGVGIAAVLYPTGFSAGGDSSQAMVKVRPDGSVNLYIGSVDLGQGCKTVFAQMVAEELGIEYEDITVIDQDTDTSPLCAITGASRVTFTAGIAVVAAAREVKSLILEVAAAELCTAPEALEMGGGKIHIKDDPARFVTFQKIAYKANYQERKLLVGRGHFMPDPAVIDFETGASNHFRTMAWGAMLAEVEVDTDTGQIEVLRLVSAYDVGKAINPLLVEGQIEGGTIMGVGAAIMEDLYPYYPSTDWQATNLGTYMIPTALDVPDNIRSQVVECPSTGGPYGVKGIGEMTGNSASPAIVNAIYDAIGVWINELPVTPDRILRALESVESR